MSPGSGPARSKGRATRGQRERKALDLADAELEVSTTRRKEDAGIGGAESTFAGAGTPVGGIVDVKELKRLLEAVEASGVSEFSLETDKYKIFLKRGPNGFSRSPVTALPEAPLPSVPPTPETAPPAPTPPPAAALSARSLVEVTAPIVGTFYRSAAPDQPPYVSVGDKVKPGQVLCIIEAMKLMNEIEAEVAGTVLEIFVQNEEPVEYGQLLFRIEPA